MDLSEIIHIDCRTVFKSWIRARWVQHKWEFLSHLHWFDSNGSVPWLNDESIKVDLKINLSKSTSKLKTIMFILATK